MTLEERTTIAGEIYNQYENGQNYFSSSGLLTAIQTCKSFYEGNQWVSIAADDTTADLPRPKLNFIQNFVDTEASNIASSKISITFKSDLNPQKAKQLTRFHYYITKEARLDDAEQQALIWDLVTGTTPFHYYWSEEARGRKGRFVGGMRKERIDPLHFTVANPNDTLENFQNQEWVIIDKQESVKRVKQMVDDNKLLSKEQKETIKEQIAPDELLPSDSDKTALQDNQLCTVFTKYFRKDGEVYFIKSTKSVAITDETPLNPALVKKFRKKFSEENIDGQVSTSPDEKLENQTDDEYMFSLYPINVLETYPSLSSFYGMGKIRDLLVIQKLVNFNLAMTALQLQRNASPIILEKQNALQDQEITNEPMQRLKDYTPGKDFGVTTLNVPQMTAHALAFSTTLLDLTKTVSNLTDAITGDMLGKDISGVAIDLILQQARKQYNMREKNYLRFKEREALICEQFYKTYYDEKKFTYEYSPMERIQQMQMNQGQLIEANGSDTFRSIDYQDYDFDLVIEAGQGTEHSELLSMQLLDKLYFEKNAISLETFTKLYPPQAMPFKEEFMELQYKDSISKEQQMLQLIEQQGMMIEQLQAQNEELYGDNKELARELKSSGNINAKLQQEATNKITTLQQAIMAMQGSNKEKPKQQDTT